MVGSEHEDSFPPEARILEITNKHGSSSVFGRVCGFFRMKELTDKQLRIILPQTCLTNRGSAGDKTVTCWLIAHYQFQLRRPLCWIYYSETGASPGASAGAVSGRTAARRRMRRRRMAPSVRPKTEASSAKEIPSR